MSLKDLFHNKWVGFIFWSLLYVLWVIWLGNYWWLFGLVVVFDCHITKKVKWEFWKKTYKEGEKPNALLEWLDAIIFAVIVVTFLNIFFFQAFKIPSSSMESTLFTGDHLFVNKLTYGPRLPETPLTIPFTHNEIFGKKSYSTAITSDYKRLKGFRKVKRGDIVVFNFPNGDTVLTRNRMADYYSLVRDFGREFTQKYYGPVIVRPMDKEDHYVKRCVAIAGDTLSVRDGRVFINSEAQQVWPGVQMTYTVVTSGQKINEMNLDKIGVSHGYEFDKTLPGYRNMPLTASMLEKIKTYANVVSVEPNIEKYPSSSDFDNAIFPFQSERHWTCDNLGPIWIPAKGATVELDTFNLPFYERIITSYEGHDLNVTEDGRIYIDGKETDRYTFSMDYYFMMGDNRHCSLDSRYWGFVPEDHIVGTPAMIWLSLDEYRSFPHNIRASRFFKIIQNSCNSEN